MEKIIRNKLYKEFIEPTKQRKNFIGIEIEVPIINLNKKPVDFDIVHKITDNFKKEFSDGTVKNLTGFPYFLCVFQ